jgi:hypothetical protein
MFARLDSISTSRQTVTNTHVYSKLLCQFFVSFRYLLNSTTEHNSHRSLPVDLLSSAQQCRLQIAGTMYSIIQIPDEKK